MIYDMWRETTVLAVKALTEKSNPILARYTIVQPGETLSRASWDMMQCHLESE
jgi:hypothetical protein